MCMLRGGFKHQHKYITSPQRKNFSKEASSHTSPALIGRQVLKTLMTQ